MHIVKDNGQSVLFHGDANEKELHMCLLIGRSNTFFDADFETTHGDNSWTISNLSLIHI